MTNSVSISFRKNKSSLLGYSQKTRRVYGCIWKYQEQLVLICLKKEMTHNIMVNHLFMSNDKIR